jgi:hypothetical protein
MPTLVSARPHRPLLDAAPQAMPESDERAGRLFPTLPPFGPATPPVQEALLDIARPGGLLDAREANPDHPAHPAGVALMAQFLYDDLPFDLESMYHGGPTLARQLYDPVDRGKFRITDAGLNGLHGPFLLAHNHALDVVRGRGIARHAEAFEEARRVLRWHYQWLIVHELLPLYVGQSTIDQILSGGRRYFAPHVAFIPVEYQQAIGRFWYSMLPSEFAGQGRPIGWLNAFDPSHGRAKRINTRLASPLFHTSDVSPQHVLLSHVSCGLPSGQSLARAMRLPVLSPRDLDELGRYQLGLERETPLWYYVLKEAHVVENGLRLGPVGGRIVGEVVLGLLELTRSSYLVQRPRWRPELPSRGGRDDFRMLDLLAFAGIR